MAYWALLLHLSINVSMPLLTTSSFSLHVQMLPGLDKGPGKRGSLGPDWYKGALMRSNAHPRLAKFTKGVPLPLPIGRASLGPGWAPSELKSWMSLTNCDITSAAYNLLTHADLRAELAWSEGGCQQVNQVVSKVFHPLYQTFWL